ncbi:MAG: protein phosphatase 2C domain-containing protein [Roseiflexaceae bacterium]
MSFLSKLFRGNNQRPEPAHADERPITLAQPPAEGQDGAPVATVATSPPATDPAQAPPEDGQTADERPWWEEPVPPEALEYPQAAEAEPSEQVSVLEAPAPDAAAVAQEPAAATPAADRSPDPETGGSDGTRQLTEKDTPALVALRSRRGLAVAAQRDIGRVRSINQDSVFACITTLPRENSDVTIGLFVVADGMGGHDGGEIASRLAVTTVARHVLTELVLPALADNVTEALQPLIITAVQDANRTIWEHAQRIGSDMGTTCTVALMLGQALYIGHVGDSRAYMATPTGMRQLTSDHSAVGRLIQVGQLDPAEAREHPLRSQLYRTVGQHPEVQVDFIYQPLGDATQLLLCSDGLWGMLDDEVLLDVLDHALWPQDACRELIARANLAGGDDNISAIVVTLPAH